MGWGGVGAGSRTKDEKELIGKRLLDLEHTVLDYFTAVFLNFGCIPETSGKP